MVPCVASTSHFVLTSTCNFSIVLGAIILGFQKYGVKSFALFVPAGKKIVLRIQNFSTAQYNYNKLNSNWVTGFSDGEACFSIQISKSEAYKTG